VPEHYESFLVMPAPVMIRRIVLIDDVITKGRTLLAAAARLQAAFRTPTSAPLLSSGRWDSGDAWIAWLSRVTVSCAGRVEMRVVSPRPPLQRAGWVRRRPRTCRSYTS
jgi:hypothetical protein